MALTLSFNTHLSCSCTSLFFTDSTGAYNATTNPGGYGAPNPLFSAATAVTLDIEVEDGTVYSVAITPLGGSEPEDFEITADSIGLDKFADGCYKLTYTVVTPSETAVAVRDTVFFCETQALVDKKLANLDTTQCSTKDSDIENALTAYTYLKSLCYHAGCGNKERAKESIDLINRICDGGSTFCVTC